MQSFADLAHALSWRVAAEFASCVPQSFIVELHASVQAVSPVAAAPPGPYPQVVDELAIRQRPGERPGMLVASINRAGTLRTAAAELGWLDVVRMGTIETAAQLLKSAGFPTKRRPTSAARRTYRLAAEILEARLPDAHQWAVRSAMLESSGYGSVVQEPLLLGLPELAAADPYQVWTVLCDGIPVLALNEGVAYYPDGYRMTVMERPSTEERAMAGFLLQRIPGI